MLDLYKYFEALRVYFVYCCKHRFLTEIAQLSCEYTGFVSFSKMNITHEHIVGCSRMQWETFPLAPVYALDFHALLTHHDVHFHLPQRARRTARALQLLADGRAHAVLAA